jgi:energy-coupling factor transport system permease protein
MDALSKLIFVVLISFAVYFFQDVRQLVFMPLILFSLALFAGKIDWKVILCSFSVFLAFGFFVGVFQLISNASAGEIIFSAGFIRVSDVAFYKAQIFLLRLFTIGCAALVYLWTTNPKYFAIGLIYLGIPYRFGYAILVALRFLPLIQTEIGKIKDAHLVRGLASEKGIKGAIENWRRYLFPVLANGLRKSETTSIAMDSRAFGLYKKRTYVEEFQWSKTGLALVASMLIIILVLGWTWGFGFIQPRYS